MNSLSGPGWGAVTVCYAVLCLLTLWHVLRRHVGKDEKAWWAAAVLLLPFAGMLSYWWDYVFRGRDEEVRRQKAAAGKTMR